MYQHERNLDDLHFCKKNVFTKNDESHFFEPSYIKIFKQLIIIYFKLHKGLKIYLHYN